MSYSLPLRVISLFITSFQSFVPVPSSVTFSCEPVSVLPLLLRTFIVPRSFSLSYSFLRDSILGRTEKLLILSVMSTTSQCLPFLSSPFLLQFFSTDSRRPSSRTPCWSDGITDTEKETYSNLRGPFRSYSLHKVGTYSHL